MEKTRRTKILARLRLIVGCVVVVAMGAAVIQSLRNPLIRAWWNPEYRNQVFRFGEALILTESYYVDKDRAGFKQLTEQALTGMTTSLDKFSGFIPAESFEEYTKDQELTYSGTGFRSWKFRGEHVVARVLPGSPAQKAGMKTGDRVTKINGEMASEWTDQEFSSRMRGPVGSNVTIDVVGPSGDRNLALRRSPVHMKAVYSYWVDSEGLGYLRLMKFTDQARSELGKVLPKMQTEGMHGIVLDLRDNPGGQLTSVVDVAGFFLPPDSLIASLESRTPELSREFRSKAEAIHLEIPMIVLINEGSASGSEALAGALHHYDRAILVGETTYGKGSAQNLFSVSHGSGINFTVAKYNLPDGSNVDNHGLDPDYRVGWDSDSKTQLYLQRDVEGMIDPIEFKSLFGVDPLPDPQLTKAQEVLRQAISMKK